MNSELERETKAQVRLLPLDHVHMDPVPTGDGVTSGGAGHMVIYDVDPNLVLEPNQVRIGRFLFTLPKPLREVRFEIAHQVRFLYADGSEESCEMREA